MVKAPIGRLVISLVGLIRWNWCKFYPDTKTYFAFETDSKFRSWKEALLIMVDSCLFGYLKYRGKEVEVSVGRFDTKEQPSFVRNKKQGCYLPISSRMAWSDYMERRY